MRAVDIIEKKVNNGILSKEEIIFFISEFMNNNIKDYQMSAFLMAIYFNSLNEQETSYLTKAMLDSGEIVNLKDIKGVKVDKHSTGGVGDKITLILAPIAAALGLKMAKMSGKGLGHTGGTIDKLDSIPNFQTQLSEKQFKEQVASLGFAIISQSDNLVPADKRIYALRDVTATVSSIPLIVSSIMSKKLASGADAIILDVKCGTGAFMKDIDEAKQLSSLMIRIGKHLNKDVRVEITQMNEPLGREVGNKNEILEAMECLKGNMPKDIKEIIYSSAITLLSQSKITQDIEDAKLRISKVINDGSALNKFYQFVEMQKGDVEKLKSPTFWIPKYKLDVLAKENGYLEIFNAEIFGHVAMLLGAGRQFKDDKIDYDAGIHLNKKTGDKVNVGDILFTFYSSSIINKELEKEIEKSFKYTTKPKINKIILERME